MYILPSTTDTTHNCNITTSQHTSSSADTTHRTSGSADTAHRTSSSADTTTTPAAVPILLAMSTVHLAL